MSLKNRIFKGAMALLAGLSLAACGNGGSESASNSGEGDGPIEIEYWHGNADTQGGQQVKELVDKFNESQDEVHVTPVYNEGLYVGLMKNLQTQAAAKKYPAVVQIGWAYREYFDENFESMKPAELIDKYAAEEDKDYMNTKFHDEFTNLAKNLEGEVLGFPYSASTAVIFVNEDLLAEAGVNPDEIKTYDDLFEAAKTVKDKTGKYGLNIDQSNDNWTSQQLIESNGGKVVTDDGKTAIGSDESVEAMGAWAKGIEEGYIFNGQTADGQQSFITGDVAMTNSTIAQRGNITRNASFNAKAIPLPSFGDKERAIPAGGSFLAVTAQDEAEQEASWKFIKFLFEPDNIAIWDEGTGYLPPTTDATENDTLKKLIEEDQMYQTSYGQMEDLVPFSSFPGTNGLQASEKFRDARDRIFTGVSASEELPKAEDEINELLN
ncbi:MULTISPECIES: ABC transporter substrate-binding protein [Aerococcus]|uniref:ABC transporter substrate-binding protein n=2 Tax=Aerococcus TaxID=1375 RepID=A0A178HDX4_9LACT|nr:MULTISPECIES: ABC transporter substrate-binding protein [Aerococcus]KAA9219347.1 ABC transporter substrate-binding protein [Aerococcus loyolae]KAA9264299.1 ABC transporter substrate-binding protein [Aerococcus loyolae]MCY3025760.1 ABC transporter substrate-binding protein [Aerococcus loyolae]MCY3027551.1 ABC transporter substrate-binding protein [Aerococcus loyolae]MCY3029909.1 ABC transporter substrate-binding protein [Aerococcus loyolae]